MARVLRTEAARNDLKSTARHIALQSQSRRSALGFLDEIDEQCRLYATQPFMGEARPDLGKDVRSFPVGNYMVLYHPREDGILLLRVLHGARDIPAVYRRFFGPTGSAYGKCSGQY